jgi:hypothetical protein
MPEIALGRFTQVGLNEKVGLARNDPLGLETRPATKGFLGRIVGWVRNHTESYRTEKREVMGAFLQALRKEYGASVGTAAFKHAIGDIAPAPCGATRSRRPGRSPNPPPSTSS